MWENKKKISVLKSIRSKKKNKKRGCYLIKEAAINLSDSSAALLHIWLLNSGHSLPLLRAQPRGDLWFLLLVSHTVWTRFPHQRSHAGTGWPDGGDCGQSSSSVCLRAALLPPEGVRRLLTWKQLVLQDVCQEEAGAPRVVLPPAPPEGGRDLILNLIYRPQNPASICIRLRTGCWC